MNPLAFNLTQVVLPISSSGIEKIDAKKIALFLAFFDIRSLVIFYKAIFCLTYRTFYLENKKAFDKHYCTKVA